MMSFCRNSVTSFLGLEYFSQTFHQTPCEPSHSWPQTPTSPPHGCTLIFNPHKSLNALESYQVSDSDEITGEKDSGEGFTGVGLISCTESLGFESSDEISTNEDSSSFISSSSKRTKNWSSRRAEKKSFPPPLTSLSENGRRNFMLRPMRKDGRLEIVGVMIERPEFLCASRQNGRLRLHLVKNASEDEDDEEETGEEREKEQLVEEEETEEEREWEIPAAGGRRCYRRELHVWGQRQQRCVRTR